MSDDKRHIYPVQIIQKQLESKGIEWTLINVSLKWSLKEVQHLPKVRICAASGETGLNELWNGTLKKFNELSFLVDFY